MLSVYDFIVKCDLAASYLEAVGSLQSSSVLPCSVESETFIHCPLQEPFLKTTQQNSSLHPEYLPLGVLL